MSHACVLVAVEGNPADRVGIEAAVAYQMAPYEEKGEWFCDGSRWDWYQIGGRFTGLLSDYDPTKDPQNIETCELCDGTGVRPGGLKQFGQAWFDQCKGCNGCHGTGKRVAFNFAPFAGDIIQVKDLKQVKASFAFLRERHWHEGERLGFFGGTAHTECEIKNPSNANQRCTYIGDDNIHIIVWNEPWELWKQSFYKRFIKPLKLETVLVVVDYHV